MVHVPGFIPGGGRSNPLPTRSARTGGTVTFFPGWEKVIGAQIVPEFVAAGKTMRSVARRLVPVDTGELKDSIGDFVRFERDGLPHAYLEATEPYADFVEYGTGRRGKATVGRGGGRIKQPPDYIHGPSRGNRAQPFLRPAMTLAVRQHFGRGR